MAGDVAMGDQEEFIRADGMGWRTSEECFGEEKDNEYIEDGKINSTKVLGQDEEKIRDVKAPSPRKILGNISTDNWSKMRTIS
jgi:hypothetical protein